MGEFKASVGAEGGMLDGKDLWGNNWEVRDVLYTNCDEEVDGGRSG